MASFARSLRSPCLSPICRPGLPGRTLSSASELSLASNHSSRSEDGTATSAPNTPPVPAADDTTPTYFQPQDPRDAAAVTSPRPRSSRPIAIELPKITRHKSSPSSDTPPEPLSGRGDLPGGYFPMHEDPKHRVHRPHPFHDASRSARQKSINLAAKSSPSHSDRNMAQSTATSSRAYANRPVASYLPAGFHDTPLPMGKYYPSNWESTHSSSQSRLGSRADSSSSTITQPPLSPSNPTHPQSKESEARRKMLQYQRDMVAQVSLALGGSIPGGLNVAPGGRHHHVLRELSFSSPSNPSAPKLAPLGSPGPVTPMELEDSATGILDRALSPRSETTPL